MTLRDEIVELVGEWAYDQFVAHVEARWGAAWPRGSCLTQHFGAALAAAPGGAR